MSADPGFLPAGWRRVVLRQEALLAIFCALQLALYVRTSLARHHNLLSNSYDLGIFGQAVDAYAKGQWPSSLIRQEPNLLGDHFSPVIALLAPAWWVWPNVSTLLVAQAVLVVLATPAVWLHARQAGDAAAWSVTMLFALFFGIQELIGFDFHEVAFAVPLMTWGLYLAQRGRLAAAAMCFCSLMLVKENFAPLVIVFGLVLLLRFNGRLLAMTCVLFGAASYLVVTGLIMPRLNDVGFLYWPLEYGHLGATPFEALKEAFRAPRNFLRHVVTPDVKVETLAQTLMGFAWVPLLSTWFLLAVPLLLERFLGINERRWGTGFHYSAVLAPVLAAGLVDVLARLRPVVDDFLRTRWHSRGRTAVLNAPAVVLLLLPVAVSPTWTGAPVAQSLLNPTEQTPRLAACRQMLATTPAGVPVEATGHLAPQLVPRNPVWLPLRSGGRARVVLIDLRTSDPIFPTYASLVSYVADLERRGYVRTFQRQSCLRLTLPPDRPVVVTSVTPYSVGSNTDGSSLDPTAPAVLMPQEREAANRS